MENAGFQKVRVQEFQIPIGAWPTDLKLKEVGKSQLVAMLDGIEALALALWTRYLGWTEEKVQVYLASVRHELRQGTNRCYWPL